MNHSLTHLVIALDRERARRPSSRDTHTENSLAFVEVCLRVILHRGRPPRFALLFRSHSREHIVDQVGVVLQGKKLLPEFFEAVHAKLRS